MSQENFMLGASEKFIVHLLSDLKKSLTEIIWKY